MFTVDIVTAIFIVVLVAIVCATYLGKYYFKIESETKVKLRKIEEHIEDQETPKESAVRNFAYWHNSRTPTEVPPVEPAVLCATKEAWEPEDPTTVFPKVEAGKEYKVGEK